jgi:hypothetical protein
MQQQTELVQAVLPPVAGQVLLRGILVYKELQVVVMAEAPRMVELEVLVLQMVQERQVMLLVAVAEVVKEQAIIIMQTELEELEELEK